jgi:hypothetical protein
MRSHNILLLTALIFPTQTVLAVGNLSAEIDRLVRIAGWPEMIHLSLQRGDLQRVAKAKLTSADRSSCVDSKYTEERVLAEIKDGYADVYSDPSIVANTADFMAKPGAKKIFAAVAARTPAVGTSAAHEQVKEGAWDSLTSEERQTYIEFASSEAGKAYLSVRPKQLRAHQERLARLAGAIAAECNQ